MYFSEKEEIGNVIAISARNLDSMNPTFSHPLAIHPDDILFIELNKKPACGKLVLAKVGDSVTIRQYIEDTGKSVLKALNIQYPIITDFEIIGTVINILKNV